MARKEKAPINREDFKVNAGIGLRPSTITRLQKAADRVKRSKSALAEEFILDGLDGWDALNETLDRLATHEATPEGGVRDGR